jgi:hypothetical protein
VQPGQALEDEDYISEDGWSSFDGFMQLLTKVNSISKRAKTGSVKPKVAAKKPEAAKNGKTPQVVSEPQIAQKKAEGGGKSKKGE